MHLFIVNEDTLPIHLQYQFAGVTKENDCSWSNVTVNGSTERAQASLYADICRVHKGDEILFYLETPNHDLGREGGRFLGIFEVTTPAPIYESGGGYLKSLLKIPLIYRHLIKPKEIFAEGLTEWQAMDEMTDYLSIHEIPWTLIYRKMVGRRGCTPLLPHETAILKRALDLRNAGQRLSPSGIGYDPNRVSLINNGIISNYQNNNGVSEKIDDYLRHLINNTTRKWEPHLQAYLMQEIGRNHTLTQQLFPGVRITWIGNEIYAGAGKQSIDILVYTENDYNSFVHLIELKAITADSDAASQMNRYIKWLKAHIPNISVHQIIPTLIAPDADHNFHSDMKLFLRGHGITQYRVITIDGSLSFNLQIVRGF